MKPENGNRQFDPTESLKLLLYCFVYLILCQSAYFLSMPYSTLPVIWLPAGFQFSVLLVAKPGSRFKYFFAGLFAGILSDFMAGYVFHDSLVSNLSISGTMLVFAFLISKYYKGNITLLNIKDLLLVVVLPAFIIPIISSLFENAFHTTGRTIAFKAGWENILFSYTIGFLVFIPFIVSWEKKIFQFLRFYKKTEFPIILLLFTLLSVISYTSIVKDLTINLFEEFIVLSILAIITYRYGIKGTSLAFLMIALVTILSVRNSLHWGVMVDEAFLFKVATLKSLFLTVFISMLLFAIVLKQNKITEFDLQHTNSLLNATLDSTENGILTVDLYGQIVMCNQKFQDLWNIPDEIAKNKNDRKLINHILVLLKSPSEFLELVEYLYSHPEKESLDFIEFNDGRIYERFSKPQKIEEKIIGRVWSFRDITEQRRLQENLIKARDAYLRVLDESPALIWKADETGSCDWFNKAWLEFTGHKLNDQIGDGWLRGVHPDDKNRVMSFYLENFDRRQTFTMEYRLLNAEEDYRWIIDTGKPNYNADKEFLGYIGYCFDITDRRNAEEKIIESEKITSELIANVPEIIIVHINGVVQFINKTGEEVFGYTNDEVVGRDLSEFIEPEQYARVMASFMRRMKGEMIDDYEISIGTRNGEKIQVIIRAVVINYYGRKAVLSILVDVTKIKEYERSLVELNDTKNKLLSIISHDLKGPFQGFLGVSDLLANQINTLDTEEIKDMALELNKSLHKQYQLLVEILNWTKLQNSGFKFEPSLLNVQKEISNAVAGLESNATRKEIKIAADVPPDLAISADPNMLQIILRNLISNAIKFSFRGGVIKVESTLLEGGTEICVSDFGVGMEKDDLERLFNIKQRFSNDGTENEQGTGLGLIFCKEIVEKHNGHINCISQPGKGSKFCIFFPSA